MKHKSEIAKLDKNFAPVEVANDLKWYDIRDLGIEGQGWRDTENPYDRLPARAKSIVRPPVWELSQHSAGLCVRFMTDSPSISARWTLRNSNLSMPHMPASGMSGLDLYAKLKGKWVWAGVGIPDAQTTSILLGGNYVPGAKLLGSDNLGTVDGVHPTDVGFMRIAKALESVVGSCLV